MKILPVAFKPNDNLYIKSYGYEDVSVNAHWGKGRRDSFILHYVIKGEGFFNDVCVKAGEGFLISPQALHEYHSSTTNPWKYFWVIFGGKSANELCGKYIPTDDNNIFEYDFKSKIINLYESMCLNEIPMDEARALSYFYMIMSYHNKKDKIIGNTYVEEAKKYMKTHYYRNLSVTEVAKSVGVDDRYLYNLFIKYENISPKKYLNNIKLSYAKTMLSDTGLSISEIAVSIGFPDVLAFSRFFSKNTNFSPTAYKNRLLEADM